MQKPDDLCDICGSSNVNVERTTYCGLTIGIECGCNEANDATCNDPECDECAQLVAAALREIEL